MGGELKNMLHEILPEGESTEKWAIREPGFLGTVKQLTHCARCGEPLPPKGVHRPRHFRDIFQATHHIICDDCYDALPD